MRHAAYVLAGVMLAAMTGSSMAQDRVPRPRVAEESKPDAKLGHAALQHLMQDYDQNKDGFLDKEEIPASWRHAFDRIDTNKDGKLSLEELNKGAVHLQVRRRPSDMVFVLIEMSDCDDDCSGEIQRVYDALRKLDRNHDGKLDAEELAVGRLTVVQERVDGIIQDLDQNKDGKLSRSEARGHVRAHFEQLDENKDGFISREELFRGAVAKVPAGEPIKPATGSKNDNRK